jgi:hypothetical protein
VIASPSLVNSALIARKKGGTVDNNLDDEGNLKKATWDDLNRAFNTDGRRVNPRLVIAARVYRISYEEATTLTHEQVRRASNLMVYGF